WSNSRSDDTSSRYWPSSDCCCGGNARRSGMQHVRMRHTKHLILPLVLAATAIAAGYGFSVGLEGYFVYLGTSVVVAATAILGLGIVTGSAGMISLCQLTFAAVGAWVVSWLSEHDAFGGFVVWLVLG